VLVGKLLEEKLPHLCWTLYVTHCIDLMLEKIGKLSMINKTIQRGVSLLGFIYSHSSLLRQFTNKRELVSQQLQGLVGTSYLSLQRLHQKNGNLRKMFISNKWSKNCS